MPRTAPKTLSEACSEIKAYDFVLASATQRFGDYAAGAMSKHVDGLTVEEFDGMGSSRLYRNAAKARFNPLSDGAGPFGRRLLYGGHASLARPRVELQRPRQADSSRTDQRRPPCRAADCERRLFARSEIGETADLSARSAVGALEARMVATKSRSCADFTDEAGDVYEPSVVLEFDLWARCPR